MFAQEEGRHGPVEQRNTTFCDKRSYLLKVPILREAVGENLRSKKILLERASALLSEYITIILRRPGRTFHCRTVNVLVLLPGCDGGTRSSKTRASLPLPASGVALPIFNKPLAKPSRPRGALSTRQATMRSSTRRLASGAAHQELPAGLTCRVQDTRPGKHRASSRPP